MEVTLSNSARSFFHTLSNFGVLISVPDFLPFLSSEHAGFADLKNRAQSLERREWSHLKSQGDCLLVLGRGTCPNHLTATEKWRGQQGCQQEGVESTFPFLGFSRSNDLALLHPSLRHAHNISNYWQLSHMAPLNDASPLHGDTTITSSRWHSTL